MQIIRDREALHRIPELGSCLPKTLTYLKQQLSPLGCEILMPTDCCLCAWFDFGAVDAIAFRSDADALPLQEQTGLSFASTHPGQMHACGHDGHMAMLLELARRLKDQPLRHNVLLIFQGAEETVGGAKALCDTGILETYNVTAIFGMHLWPELPFGQVYSRSGEMMSRSCEVTVRITGRSAHIAKAQQGLDALAAGVEFYRGAQALEQALPPEEHRLLRFGRMESGSVRNAVAGAALLEGTMRTFRDETFAQLRAGLQSLAEQVGKNTGCAVSLSFSEGYPPTWNDPDLFSAVQAKTDVKLLSQPSMITEDFSWYQRFVPGVFFFLGIGQTPELHAPDFDFDPLVLEKGADFLETLAQQL